MSSRALLFAASMPCLVVACGGGGSSPTPTAPSTPTVTVTNLAISAGAGLLLVGSSEQYTATASYSDGSTRAVAAAWSSNNASVVTVDSAGRVTAVGAGTAAVSAAAEGRTASTSVRGLPDFAGNWRLQWRTTTCDVPPRWGSGFCNVSGLVTMTLNLSRSSGDQVVGSINNGIGWTGTVSGSVSLDGVLNLTGRATSVRPSATFHSDYLDWRTRLSPTDGMTGSYRELLTWVGERDQGFIANEVIRATR